MAFDFGAGLAAMGETVAKLGGAAALEAQRAELAKESMVLANELAGERESRGRKESHGYDMEKLGKTQEFDKWKVETTEAGANSRNAASVGASLAVARMGIDARAAENDKMIQANERMASQMKIGADGTAFSVNPVTQTVTPLTVNGEPMKFADPEEAKARLELVKVRTAQIRDVNQTYQPQIQSLESSLRAMQKEMVTGQKPSAEMIDTEKRLKAVIGQRDEERSPLLHELNQLSDYFTNKGKVGAPTPSKDGRPDIGSLITIPGVSGTTASPPVTGKPDKRPRSLIDSTDIMPGGAPY